MAHLQYIPGDPRLVDQLVYELKSKGIFDQFRKDCIADVDTRPAYQNLRQRVENSVTTFLSRQVWKPDLNKNQLREKLRKHILDGNYLEQGVERIVDQVVNPKVASVFIPQVEDLVYNYLGITRKKTTPVAETSNGKVTENDLLPTDLEAVSPGSVKSNDEKNEEMEISQGEDSKMELDSDKTKDENDVIDVDKDKTDDTRLSGISELTSNESMTSIEKSNIPLPSEEIKFENIPVPENSPPTSTKVKMELEKIELPEEPNPSTDIPLPDETPKSEKETYFKPVNSDDEDSSSDSSLRRNMSPLTPIRNFNNENSYDAQQAFEDEDTKPDKIETDKIEPSTFRFTIESKATENSSDAVKTEKKETDQANLSYQFNNQININTYNTPLYDDSSNSTHLQIDYESDANSKYNAENKVPEPDLNSEDSRKNKKTDDRKSSHKSSHRDSHRHSSSKDRRSDSKQSSKDTKSDKKSSKDDHKSSSKSTHKEKSSERDKKDEKKDKDRDSSKHRSSHKSSSSSHKDSKSHKSSSSSQRHSSSSKHSDEKRSSSSSHRDKERSSDKYSKDKSSKESKSSSSSHRSDKDRKSSSSSKSKNDDKERQKKDKKETDDHYSASGRANHPRRSTDRDSNDGSSSSKGSHHPSNSKASENKKENKGSNSKSDNTSTSADSTSPSDKDHVITEKNKNESKGRNKDVPQVKPIVRIENHLETPISSPPRLPFVPDVTLKKPKFAANMQEAKKLMKMRKFLDEEQKRMNQEAALLLEFQANVRPSLSQVYSSIPGPELEFACVTNNREMIIGDSQMRAEPVTSGNVENVEQRNDTISDILTAAQQVDDIDDNTQEVPNVEVKTLEAQEVILENVPKATEGIVVESDIDEEVNQLDTATVQIESIIEADITSCEMEVDKTIDEKTIQIIDNVSTDVIEPTEGENNDENKVISDVIIHGTPTIEFEDRAVEVIYNDGIEAQLQSLMPDEDDNNVSKQIQITIVTEELSESEEIDDTATITAEDNTTKADVQIEKDICPNETPFEYFAEHEKYKAELERDRFSKFLKSYTERSFSNKIHVINCDSYEESIIKEASQNIGDFEIINYYKNGHLKLNTAKKIVKNVNVSSEISLPVDKISIKRSPIFSPVKSECSFELSSDYDAKLEEMVSKTSRKEIMEIILGNVSDDNMSESSEMPTIDYCMDSNIESDTENTLKRKMCEVESTVNNNRQVLTPNKIRKLSGSDQISSTTEESEETSNNNVSIPMRSKYLGRAKRVGLPRPRRSNLPNSPSSDKSVENYEQNTTQANGKIKPRKVQRYDTSDLYKPKLHYLSRRNNIS